VAPSVWANDDPEDDYWPDFMDWSGEPGKVKPNGSHLSTVGFIQSLRLPPLTVP
jgi:hypothetical protein